MDGAAPCRGTPPSAPPSGTEATASCAAAAADSEFDGSCVSKDLGWNCGTGRRKQRTMMVAVMGERFGVLCETYPALNNTSHK